jgi:tRNA pseudouridine32 synthase/23S rRNA pseudouridine746 synthase
MDSSLIAPSFPSPFDDVGPHPVARQAALELQDELRSGRIAPGVDSRFLGEAAGGKMFGVLVTRGPDGDERVLRAFSGQIGPLWELPGWAPPVFDMATRNAIEPGVEARIKALGLSIEETSNSSEFRIERDARNLIRHQYAEARRNLNREQAERRAERRRRRDALAPGDRTARLALDNESRRDDIQHRHRHVGLREDERRAMRSRRRLADHVTAMARLRRHLSRRVMRDIHDTYVLTSFSGRTTTLRELFGDTEPPWGAGDCAAPKLIAQAIREGLTPIALAEFWWGAPPPGGGRVEGEFYPACTPKCGPILPFLLDGLDVARRRTWQPAVEPADHLDIRHEDGRVVILSKPAGLLSVPARDESIADSVLARLKRRYPEGTGPLLVHRLDLDTSGLLVAALDEETHGNLQAQFEGRTVRKRYVAWVEGELAADRGTIALPIRVDLDQRPRQVVDFVHGKEAITDWKVLERRPGRTKVGLFPRTGRTHQLRVHAAHRDGLNAPIVGDRLYGTPGERLLLHAESLTLRLPDGRRFTIADPAPFG